MRVIDWGKYIKKEDGNFYCRDCDSQILKGIIARSIWIKGDTPQLGTGQVHQCEVPYCPKCELEADWERGEPLYERELHSCPQPPGVEVTPQPILI